MAANFPGSIDNGSSLPNPAAGNFTNSPSLSNIDSQQNSAIIAIESKLGTGASTPTNNTFLVGNGTGTSAWSNTVPAGTVVGTSDSQTLTNKTLTSPTITSPTITNATISTDTITGFSSSTSGSIFGITVTSGTIGAAALATGIQIPDKMKNPYKFGVYRAAAANTGNAAFALVTFDTKEFDTGSNYNTSTGVFTAPIAGFYQFSATASINVNSTTFIVSFFKNGSEFKRGNDLRVATQPGGINATALMQLNANDTVDVRVYANTTLALNVGQSFVYFQGFLVSAT
jgi:C1q domain